MFQKIKKILIYTISIIGILLLLIILLLQSSSVQTYITKKASNFLEEHYSITADIKRVNIAFPDVVKLEDILIYDHNSDTLAFLSTIDIDLKSPTRIAEKLEITSANIEGGFFKIITYPGDSINSFTHLLNKFASEDTTTSSGVFGIELENLHIANTTLLLVDSGSQTTFSTKNLEINNFVFSDSLLSVDLLNSDLNIENIVEANNITGNYKIIDNRIMEVNDFYLKSGKSEIATSARVEFPSTDMNWEDYKTKYTLDLKKLEYDTKDVHFDMINEFIPGHVSMNANVSGTAKSLKINKLETNVNHSFANLSGRVKYPFIPRKTNFKLNFNTLDVDAKTALFYIPDNDTKKTLKPIFPLHYEGLYKGNFVYNESKGYFNTPIGNVDTDVQLLLENNGKSAIYFADLIIDEFQLNTMLNNDDLGKTSMAIKIEGEGFDWNELAVKINADIKHFEYNQYDYKDVDIMGHIQKDVYKGALSILDSNVAIDFEGLVDLRKSNETLNFKANIDHIDFQALKFTDSTMFLSSQLNVNLDNINVDEADGHMRLNDVYFQNENGNFNIDYIELITIQKQENSRELEILSDIFEVKAKGDFKLLTFPDLVQKQIQPYLDYNQPDRIYANQSIDLEADLKNTLEITKTFIPGLKIANGTKLSIKKDYSGFPKIKITSPYVVHADLAYKDFELNLQEIDQKLNAQIHLSEIDFRTEAFTLKSINLNNNLLNNTLESQLDWISVFDSTNYSGQVSINTKVDTNFSTESVISESSNLYMADSLWHVSAHNLLTFKDGNFSIFDFELKSNDQAILVNSVFGDDSLSNVKVDFTDFDLNNLNPYLLKQNTEIQGKINGAVSAKHLTSNIELESLITIDSTVLNKLYLGDITAYSYHDYDIDEAGFNIDIIKNKTHKLLTADLHYNINEGLKSYQLDATLDKFRIDYIDPYINEWVKDLKGKFNGKISMNANTLNSTLKLERITFRIPAIGEKTIYNIDGRPTFTVDYDKLHIDEFKLNATQLGQGKRGKGSGIKNFGQAKLSGNILHDKFSNFLYDLNINFDDFICLSTDYDSETIFFGDAFVSGNLEMTGANASPIIKIDASTSKGTKLTLAYSDQSEIGEESFIQFKKPKVDTVVKENIFIEEAIVEDDLEIDLNLKVNPSSIMTFKIDESVLTGQGSGDLNLKFNSNLDFDLYGNYVVEKADYMFAFTTGLVEAKKFDIEKGGKVIWNGDPMKGRMEIKAQYNSNLPSLDKTITSKKVVHSIINLEGELLQPKVNFAIEIPDATDDESIELNNLTNSEEKLAKQFLSILIMNSFYIEEDGITQNLNNQLVTSTAGLLTSQLNKWLNDTQNEFDDIGVRINPGTGGDLNSQEVELYLSKNFLDDRLRLNGNVGTPIGANTTGVKGNFELEYDIKKDGKLKLSVFNRSGESAEKEIQYTQGLGLFYRIEYDKIFDLFRKKKSTN